MTTIELPDYNDPEWWSQAPGEDPAAWQARTSARSNQESYLRDYQEYSGVIDFIMESYRTEDGEELDQQEVTKLVSAWIYDQGVQAHEEKEEELKDDYESTAGEIASGESWVEYEPEEEEED